MRIAVVGSGYVGLVAGACFADLGHHVILVDNDEQKLAALKNGQVPIHEKFLPELLSRHRGNRLTFSDNLHEAVRGSAAIFVAVGTPPTERGDADLSYVESVAREISGAINDYKVVVEKSTVPVYTSEWVRRIILRNGAEAESFDVASNPEFLREGTAVTDFLFPDRIVVGCDNERCAGVLREVYAPLTSGSYYERSDAIPQPDRASIPAPIIVTSTKSAELIKHASNAFLAMKISFINAVASVCESVGANVGQVVHGVGTDSRIGPRFLNPGIGYGGSCFPKDVLAFRAVARECGYDFRLLDEVMRINEDQRERFLRKITAYDPAAMERTQEAISSTIKFADSAYDAAKGADALLILTEWEEFANLDLHRLNKELKYPIVIDGRNLYDPELMAAHGFTYYSVGRAASHPDGVPAAVLRNGNGTA